MKTFAKSVLKMATPPGLFLRMQVMRAMRGCDEVEVAMLPLLARTGSFVDVGANMGSWTGAAARSFCRVHAFEPLAELADALRKVAPSNVVVHEIALSNHAGTARFGVPVHDGELLSTRASLQDGANLGFEEVARQVTLATLDSLDLRGVDAIKVDVEGHEEAMLDGALGTIKRERPTLIIEIEERHHPGRSELIINRIEELGYMCTFVRDGHMQRYQSGSIEDLQPAVLVPEPRKKPVAYFNNFIFTPIERQAEMDSMAAFLERRNR